MLTLLIALAGVLALTAQGPAPAMGTRGPWCTRIPLPRTGCRPLEVRTGRATLHLAVAATEAQREHGLMNVRYIPYSQGMIFAFPDGDQTRGFWMKDTVIPLDMVFVRGDGTITDVAVNVPATRPKTPDDKIARRQGLGRYVIEVGSGQAGVLGLLPGSTVVVPPVEAR